MIGSFASESLYYLPYVNASATIGLHEGTLYEVLEPNTGTGNASVEATGFNITCGSWEGNTPFSGGEWILSPADQDESGEYLPIQSTRECSSS
jgi:hypothetical protein